MEQQSTPGPPQWSGPPWSGPPWWGRPGDGPRGSRLPWRSTLLLTVLVIAGTRAAALGRQGDRAHLDALAYALLLVAAGALLWRQRYPVPVVFVTAMAATVYLGAGYPYGPVFLTVAVGCFGALAAGHRTAAWTAVGLFWAGHVLVSHWLYRWLPPAGDSAASWGQELVIATWVVAFVAVAELVRVRREQWARERVERAQAAQRRADEERLRIARELHDVLAHSISVINVQAGVGLALLDSDPEQARTALTTIKAAGKEALGEVRQVLDTLRAPGDAPRAPAPGLGRLPELVEQAASAGLAVTVEGTAPRLAPGADLAAFRIVQEALTNVVRHSGSRRARVHLDTRADALRLRVDDDGPATAADGTATGAGAGSGGNGLAGMRERAAALGGTVEAGVRPDGGFRVVAVVPLTTSAEDSVAPREGR
ncbi:sensor histidine kinase [Streptomyces sp. NPDC052040]|uniref:sensor histidine kinase n=1 Tax=Streptomyces sp. NPDC052040 TaxID=3365682 RepID=UPI0037CE0A9E